MTTANTLTSTTGSESCNAIEGVKFNKHHISFGGVKARVWYSLDNQHDHRKCVTLYAKDYSHALRGIFNEAYENKTDMDSDYFDKGVVRLFEDHPLYVVARLRAATV